MSQPSRKTALLADLLPPDMLDALLAVSQRQLHKPIVVVDGLAHHPRVVQSRDADAQPAGQPPGESDICQRCDVQKLSQDALQYYRDYRDESSTAYRSRCSGSQYCLLRLIRCDDEPLAALRVGPYDARLPVAQPNQLPNDLDDGLTRLAGYVQRYADLSNAKNTLDAQRAHLKYIRAAIQDRGVGNNAPSLPAVKEAVSGLLNSTCEFCEIRYAAFFTNVHPDEWVLPAMGSAGLPVDILDKLPHFNWKKSGLPLRLVSDSPAASQVPEIAKGIRGEPKIVDNFQDVALVWPVQVGQRHQGVFVFGPRTGSVRHALDMEFIAEVCDTISSYAFIEIDFYLKEQEKQRWQSAAQLINHQIGTITAQVINLIAVALQPASQASQALTSKAAQQLRLATAQCFDLKRSAQRTVDGRLTEEILPEDLQKEWFPLAVLVENCVDSFAQGAAKGGRTFITDDSVLRLPSAEVDTARLSIVLSNILHNAMKYSFPNTKIFVRTLTNCLEDTNNLTVTIEIDDLGDEIPLDEQQNIFNKGIRGKKHTAQGRIEGTGLGLWEAQSIIHAHGGSLKVSCEPTAKVLPQGRGYKVIFSVTLPLTGSHKQTRESK